MNSVGNIAYKNRCETLERQIAELLDACRKASLALGAHGPCDNGGCDMCHAAFVAVREVLAKAKGEE